MSHLDQERKCQGISFFGKASDFQAVSKEHYKSLKECRFPPSYYLEEGATKKFGDMLEDLLPTNRIVTGYSPVEHLALLGFTDKDFIDNSINMHSGFENVVTVLVPEKSMILMTVVVEEGMNAEEVRSGFQNAMTF